MDEMLGHLGIELATSMHILNRLKDHWCKSDIFAIPFFHKTMAFNTFLNIRAVFHVYALRDPDVAVADPLWHNLKLIEQFYGNAATIVIPVGVS